MAPAMPCNNAAIVAAGCTQNKAQAARIVACPDRVFARSAGCSNTDYGVNQTISVCKSPCSKSRRARMLIWIKSGLTGSYKILK